jgi:hypothetical protein
MPLTHQVAEFVQVNAMAGKANKAATEGACHNFSIHWISLMYENPAKAGANGRMAALTKGGGEANPVLQKVFGDKWSREGADGADYLMARLRGLTTAGDLIAYTSYNVSALKQEVDKTEIAGMLYSFWFDGSVPGAGGGAHSIAFFRNVASRGGKTGKSDSTVVVFDPNFGECWVPDNEYQQWMGSLFGNYGPVKNHWLKGLKKF